MTRLAKLKQEVAARYVAPETRQPPALALDDLRATLKATRGLKDPDKAPPPHLPPAAAAANERRGADERLEDPGDEGSDVVSVSNGSGDEDAAGTGGQPRRAVSGASRPVGLSNEGEASDSGSTELNKSTDSGQEEAIGQCSGLNERSAGAMGETREGTSAGKVLAGLESRERQLLTRQASLEREKRALQEEMRAAQRQVRIEKTAGAAAAAHPRRPPRPAAAPAAAGGAAPEQAESGRFRKLQEKAASAYPRDARFKAWAPRIGSAGPRPRADEHHGIIYSTPPAEPSLAHTQSAPASSLRRRITRTSAAQDARTTFPPHMVGGTPGLSHEAQLAMQSLGLTEYLQNAAPALAAKSAAGRFPPAPAQNRSLDQLLSSYRVGNPQAADVLSSSGTPAEFLFPADESLWSSFKSRYGRWFFAFGVVGMLVFRRLIRQLWIDGFG